MSHTDNHLDRLDIIDELNKELSSLNAMHLLMHTHLKAALSSNEMQMTRNELQAFNCGIENLVIPRFAKASALMESLTKTFL